MTRQWKKTQELLKKEQEPEPIEPVAPPALTEDDYQELKTCMLLKKDLEKRFREMYKCPVVVTIVKNQDFELQVRGVKTPITTWGGKTITYVDALNIGLSGVHN